MEDGDRTQPLLPVPARSSDTGLLLDLGRQHRPRIRGLKRGNGRLAREIRAAVERSCEQLGIDPAAEIVPVVLLYRCGEAEYTVVTPRTFMLRQRGE